MSCIKCGKCCTRCEIVRDILLVEHVKEFLLLLQASSDQEDYIKALEQMRDHALERNARRKMEERLRIGF